MRGENSKDVLAPEQCREQMQVLRANSEKEVQILRSRTEYNPEGLKIREKDQEFSTSIICACAHIHPPQLYHDRSSSNLFKVATIPQKLKNYVM